MQAHISFLLVITVSMVVCSQELDTVYANIVAGGPEMYLDQEPFYVNDHRIASANRIFSNFPRQFYFMDTTAHIEWTETISETIDDYSKIVVLSDCSYLVRFISGTSLSSNLSYIKDLNSNVYYPFTRKISARDDKSFYVLDANKSSITNVDTNNTVLWSTIVDTKISENAKVITAKDNGCLVLNYPYLKKYSTGGSLDWTLQVHSNNTNEYSITNLLHGAKFPNGDFFIILNGDITGAQLLRITNEGKIVWKRLLQRGSDYESSVSSLSAKNNRFLLCGFIGIPEPAGSTNVFATLVDTSGNFVWYSYNFIKTRGFFTWALYKNDSSLFVFRTTNASLYKFHNPPVFNQSFLPLKPTARIGEVYTDTVAATDPFSGDRVRYFSISSLPGFTIDSMTGIIHWVPPPTNYASREKVMIIAQDRLRQNSVYDYFITVSPGENSPPVLTDIKLSSNVISEGDSVSLRAIAKDNDNDSIKIVWLLNGKDTLSKQIAMMYRSNYKSSRDSIVVSILDNSGNETRKRVPLTVQNKALPPVPLITTNSRFHFGDTIAWTWGVNGIDPDLDTNNILFTARLYQTGVVTPKYFTYSNSKQQFIILNDSLLSKMNDTYYPFEFAIEAHDSRYSTGFNSTVKFLFKSTDSTFSISNSPAETSIRINKRTGELLITLKTENGMSMGPLHVSILNLQGKTLLEKSYRSFDRNFEEKTIFPLDLRKIAKGMLIARVHYKGKLKTYVIQTIM